MELMSPNNNGRQDNRPAGFRFSERDESCSHLIQDERTKDNFETILIPGLFLLALRFFHFFFCTLP